MNTVALKSTLTPDEHGRFGELEAVVKAGQRTFEDVAKALAEIRDSRLYRDEFGTFEEYCRERWGWTRQHANQLIRAAETVAALPAGLETMVSTERAARALAAVPAPARVEVLEAVQASGKPATAAQITLTAAELGKIHPKKTAAPVAPPAPVNPPETPESSDDDIAPEPTDAERVPPPAEPEGCSDPYSELVYWWGQASQDVRNRFCHHARLAMASARPVNPQPKA